MSNPIKVKKELKDLILSLGIREVKQAIEEIKAERIEAEKIRAKKKQDLHKWFKNLVKIMHSYPSTRLPDCRLHDAIIDGEWVTLFEQALLTGHVWCQPERVWNVVGEHHDNHTDIERTIKELLEEHLGWQVKSVSVVTNPSGWINTLEGKYDHLTKPLQH